MGYNPWGIKEIQEYQKIKSDNPLINGLYLNKSIPVSNPDERAKLLARKLKLTAIYQQTIIDIAKAEGRPRALNQLEEIFLLNFA